MGNPGDPNDVRLAVAPGVRAAHETGSSIYRHVRGTWVEDAAGFPGAQSLIPVLAAEAERWYALSNRGLFRQAPSTPAWQLVTALPEWQAMHPTCFAQLA